MTPEEKKRIQRALIIRFGIMIGIKIATAVILNRWSKSMTQDLQEADMDVDLDTYVNPYTRRISDGSVGSLVRVEFN